ncbi:hypothetical protein bpr_II356 (plasmid) [Butyrivibrio proteoclasticus B316]|uniref:Uncharacterized protein n=1 Tax=Butyrivibrio proteoclasticus (strain ATCC 51982 / DSM 14932 / B316) TaxID=515622 RepID=E0S4G1_BUTPB|nr:hypothetical protein [Butyrivibrio proteoclasticus]ADL36293.1 hypothetical protein bpr_II356 [Butyrivibrio proteoclasticus B316]
MIEMNDELVNAMQLFKKEFGDDVPLRELPPNATNKMIIEAVKESISQKRNMLPERFGYDELDDSSDLLI